MSDISHVVRDRVAHVRVDRPDKRTGRTLEKSRSTERQSFGRRAH